MTSIDARFTDLEIEVLVRSYDEDWIYANTLEERRAVEWLTDNGYIWENPLDFELELTKRGREIVEGAMQSKRERMQHWNMAVVK